MDIETNELFTVFEEPLESLNDKQVFDEPLNKGLDQKREKRAKKYSGDSRILITFSSYGTLGKYPQKMGKKKGFIPDGLSGSHHAYGETWYFSVTHGPLVSYPNPHNIVRIIWEIKNIHLASTFSLTESDIDARKRAKSGTLVCCRLFKEALKTSVNTLRDLVEFEESSIFRNEYRVNSLNSRIGHLQPKRFSEGPLMFGLKHKVVQDKMIQHEVDLLIGMRNSKI